MHHKVVGNFRSEADVWSLYYIRWSVLPKFATHGRSVKSLTTLEVMAYYLVVHTGPGVSTASLKRGVSQVCMSYHVFSHSKMPVTDAETGILWEATLPNTWRHFGVRTRTGWPGVSTKWLEEPTKLDINCNCYMVALGRFVYEIICCWKSTKRRIRLKLLKCLWY